MRNRIEITKAKLDPSPLCLRKSGIAYKAQSNGLDSQPETGLGIIDDIVNAAGSLVPLLIHIFKKPPADTWSIWSGAEKTKYVTQSLQIATTAVITGKAISVTNVFRELIAKVATNYSWEKWKKKNFSLLLLLFNAEDELKQYRASGYNKYMEYINPQMIYRIQHPTSASTKPATASMLGGNSMMLVLAIGAGAILIKEFASKPEEEKVFYVSENAGNGNKKAKS